MSDKLKAVSQLISNMLERDGTPARLEAKDELQDAVGETLERIADLEQQLQELRAAAKELVFWNLPTRYVSDDDDVGECPYCQGWNMRHSDDCVAVKLEQLLREGESDE